MTLHITYDHEGPECGAAYIPYGKEIRCPQCNLLEEERFETFVYQAAYSARYNRHSYRQYTPPAWGCFSLGDNILYFIFHLLDSYAANDKGELFETFTACYVADANFEANEYLREYMAILAVEVYREIQKQRKTS